MLQFYNFDVNFQVLIKSSSHQLFTLGKGKFYREDDSLQLDVGPFAAALEFASERSAVVCGKPGEAFFRAGAGDLGVQDLSKIVMVGDDIVSDVGGAQAVGIRGVQVTIILNSDWLVC